MQYTSEELKLYRIVEKAITPYLLIFMILLISPFFIGMILSIVDILFNTSFVSLVEKIFFSNNLLFFVILTFFTNGIGITLISTTKYFGNLFAKQKIELQESIKNTEEITIIEIKMSEIEKTIKRILFLRRILFRITTKTSFTEINNYFQTEINIFISSILNLRSDLQIRLAEQQQTLEQAKSEVEKTVKGSTELNQVSELQRARLDQQIAQFEELQRVLVKG